jgi:uncharacterized protein YndB with AHSA1/START domain
MPTISRSRDVPAPPAEVWRLVGDPYHLPRWWPRVARVESVKEGRFTEVLTGARSGRAVKADFRIKEKHKERLLRFTQDIEGSPFEKVLKEAETRIELEPAGEGTTVSIVMRQRPRGMARFGGGTMMRRATGRILDEALDGLENALGQA